MTKEEISTENMILVAIMKAYSEQSTYLTGLLKHGLKSDLREIVNRADNFIKDVEKNLPEVQQEYIQNVTDIYHNITIEARKNLNKQYKDLQNAKHS